VDIDDVNVEHGRNNFEPTKIVVKRINVKKKTEYKNVGEKIHQQ
jgi:hypothetical protein